MKKHLTSNMQGGWNETVEDDYKGKPRVIDTEWIRPYWLLRDRVIYQTCDDESKKKILMRYKV